MNVKQEHSLPSITIFGSGCIGCYLAGVLLPSYQDNSNHEKITLVGRTALKQAIDENGLKITDYLGYEQHITSAINVVTSIDVSSTDVISSEVSKATKLNTDILVVTLKCTSIEQSLNEMAHLVNEKTTIICLQNGIGSEEAIIKAFPNNEVLTGVVGFNSLAITPSHFHRGTQGDVLIQHSATPAVIAFISLLNKQQLPSELVNNIVEVRWGKLLLNLNNCINALAGIPLKDELSQRAYRQVLSAAMKETLATLKKAKIKPEQFTDVPPQFVPFILNLPNFLFTRLANKMLAIDPLARSSMWHDIEQNKGTEIEYLNNAVVKLAKQMQLKTPVNSALVKLIKITEKNQTGCPKLTANVLKKQTGI